MPFGGDMPGTIAAAALAIGIESDEVVCIRLRRTCPRPCSRMAAFTAACPYRLDAHWHLRMSQARSCTLPAPFGRSARFKTPFPCDAGYEAKALGSGDDSQRGW